MLLLKRPLSYLVLALPLLLTVFLYAYSLRLPFYLDDLPHYSILRRFADGGLDALWFFWGGNGIYPYYRPAMFTVWKIGQWLAGTYDPLALHLVNVWCYGLAAVVLGLLTRRIMRPISTPSARLVAGLVAGVGFAIYPFSYQAVTLVGALGHLGLALGVGLALYFGLIWLSGRGGVGVLLLCWSGAALAIFNHENGILLIGLLGLLIMLLYGVRAVWQPRSLWLLLPIGLLTLVYTVVWFSIPKLNSLALRSESFFESLATLGQGLAFPVMALLRPFIVGDADVGLLLLVIAVAVSLAWLFLVWRSKALVLRAGYGLVWYAVGVVPAALLLLPDYISGSPRLSLFSAMGAAIFWALLAAALWSHTPRRLGRPVLVLGAVLTLLVAVNFLLMRRAEYMPMSDYTWRLVQMIDEQQPAELLLINPPDYVAPLDEARTFLRGGEGVAFIGDLVTFEDMVWANTGQQPASLHAISINSLKQNSGYILFTHQPALEGQAVLDAVRAADAIYVTYFDDAGFYPVYVGGAGLAGPETPLASFGQGEIVLTGGQASFSPKLQTLTVWTRWQVVDPQPVKLGVYVFCDGQFIAQRDGAVWGGTYPFSAWTPGEIQTDLREIDLPASARLECLQVFTALYQETDGVRWSAEAADTGALYSDNLVPLALVGEDDSLFPLGS